MPQPAKSNPKTTIAPFLSVRNGIKAVEFYKAAFGATEQFRHDDGSGSIVAKLAVDDAEFWLADESPAQKLQPRNPQRRHRPHGPHRRRSRRRLPESSLRRSHRRREHDKRWRIGRIADPFGHHWEIGKPLPKNS